MSILDSDSEFEGHRPRQTPATPFDWEKDCLTLPKIDDTDRDLFFIELRDHLRAHDREDNDG